MIKPVDNPSHLGSTVSEKHFSFGFFHFKYQCCINKSWKQTVELINSEKKC